MRSPLQERLFQYLGKTDASPQRYAALAALIIDGVFDDYVTDEAVKEKVARCIENNDFCAPGMDRFYANFPEFKTVKTIEVTFTLEVDEVSRWNPYAAIDLWLKNIKTDKINGLTTFVARRMPKEIEADGTAQYDIPRGTKIRTKSYRWKADGGWARWSDGEKEFAP